MMKFATASLASLVTAITLTGAASAYVAVFIHPRDDINLCINVQNGSASLQNCRNARFEGFRVESTNNPAIFRILGEGGCLTAGPQSGDIVTMYRCDASNIRQRWRLLDNDQIKNGNDMCLDAAGGQLATGVPIIAFPCHKGANQRWKRMTPIDDE